MAVDLSNLQIDLSGLDIDVGAQPQGGLLERGGNALRSGARNILESGATTAEQTGMPGFAGALRSIQPSVPEGYQSPGARFVNEGRPGFEWDSFVEAVVEQFPQLGLSLGTRAAGAAVGSVAGPAGAAAGAFLGPALTQAYQQVGPVALERARNNGREQPNREDWLGAIATAGASGILESIGVRGVANRGAGVLRRGGDEFLTETGQGLVQQTGETALTDRGLQIDLGSAVGEGLIGGGAGVTTAAAMRPFERTPRPAGSDIRSDDSTDAELAQRIAEQTGPNGEAMDLMLRGRGDQTGGVNSAIQNVRSDLITEGRQARTALLSLARLNGDTDAISTVERFARKALNRNDTNVTQADIERLESAFGDTEEGQRLISIARQRARLNEFLQPNATYGPLTKITRNFDPFEKNASGVQRTVGVITGAIPGLVANRAAGALERLTGTYSPVERFVRQNSDRDAPSYTGESALDRVDAIKQSKQRSDTSNEIWEALAAEKRAQGEDVTGEQLRQQVLMREADNRLKRSEETAANLAMGGDNRAARAARNAAAGESLAASQARRQTAEAAQTARNAIAAESLAAAQARRQAAETAARTAREREISTTQQLALKTKLAELTNEIAAGRLEITQASARVADALAQNKLAQSNIRGRILEIAEQLAQRRLSKSQADAAMRQAVEEEAKTRKEEAKRTKSEAEAASKEASAETSLNGRQDSSVSPEQRSILDEAIQNELAFINGDNSAFTETKDYGQFYPVLKKAKGMAARIAIQQLRNDLARKGQNATQINTLIEPLESMDDGAVLRAERERILKKLAEDLEFLELDRTPEGDKALRIASVLRDAGSNKVAEGYVRSDEKKDDPEVDNLRKELSALSKALSKLTASPGTQQPIVVNVNIPGVGPVAAAQAYVNSGGTVVPTKSKDDAAVDPVEAGKEITSPLSAPVPPTETPPKKPGGKAKKNSAYDEAVKKHSKPKAAGDKKSRAKGITSKLAKEEVQLARAKELAPRYPEVAADIDRLSASENPTDKVKALILESGTDHHTFLSLSYAYANRYLGADGDTLRQAQAAPIVLEAILDLKRQGIAFSKTVELKSRGRSVKTAPEYGADGKKVEGSEKVLSDIQVSFNDKSPFYQTLEIAKSHNKISKLPAASVPPEPLSEANDYKTKVSPGIDGFSRKQRAEAKPLIDFLNKLRSQGTGINTGLFNTIVDNLGETNNLSIEDALNPRNDSGKREDKSGMRAFALLKSQIPNLQNGVLFQEWHADKRGRVYPRNGSATTQGGDFMKAMTRAPEAVTLKSQEAIDLLWQSWGNIVAEDNKDSINGRINAYVEAVPALLKLAESPFPKDGKYAPEIENLFQEGPLQTVAVALDTKDMVDFVKARHKGGDIKKLLRDPEVVNDLMANWKTSAVPQTDGNNNSFQLQGAFLGDETVLQATSMMPREGDDPDPRNRRVADIYLEPAVKAVEEELSDSLIKATESDAGRAWLRGVIKNSVSTYVYDSSLGGASQSVFKKLVKGYDDWVNPKYLTNAREDVKKTSDGLEFTFDGRPFRVRKDDGEFVLEATVKKGKRKGEWYSVGSFDSEKLAVDYPVIRGLSNKLTSATRDRVESMYPGLRKSMNFFRKVAQWGRESGNKPISFKTPDGVELAYQSDESPSFKAMEFKSIGKDGKEYTKLLPVASFIKESGRGLSANFTHAYDAYVLREAAKRSGVRYYNAIHDSHGFAADEAPKGNAAVLEVMAEIASLPNPFEQLVKDNNIPIITPEQYVKASPSSPIVGAMREDDYNALLGAMANEPGWFPEDMKTLQRKVIVIPNKKIVKIDPKQILTAVS
ncbi:DNA-directed RNA polymerase, phage-type [uncultured Caudovirales phage]|uniref:DNA-directed RNA polymerase, phage-type n=1 Tax=uncultured Caudovirales phage TaxID=2100421 RepID=A0A6J5NLE6_9CAUD|nr:DNA-directed RNA polymerase, phage-type [uncultured Caudovirales phage]